MCNTSVMSSTERSKGHTFNSPNMPRSRPASFCHDCHCAIDPRSPDYYMVKNEVWDACADPGVRMLCWACLEIRAKRELTLDDLFICRASWRRYQLLLMKPKRNPRRKCVEKVMRKQAIKACPLMCGWPPCKFTSSSRQEMDRHYKRRHPNK